LGAHATPRVEEPSVKKGRISMAEDFDTLPPDILAAMEGAEDIGGDED
jgi:hypothetical protein